MHLCTLPVVLCLAACASAPAAPAQPAWLTALIENLGSAPRANPPASIVRYTYEGRTVYYLPPKCCDFPSQLLDADGERLCSPDGGLTGRGDRQCPDFHANKGEGTLIWKDARERERRR